MRNVIALEGLPREDWLAARRQGIGSSDAPAIMEVSPWAGPFDVWADKVSDEAPVENPNDMMLLGTLLEGGIAEMYAAKHGVTVSKPTHMYAHDEHDWMLANPDRFIDGDGRLLEVKLGVSSGKFAGGLPDEYTVQCLHQLAVVDTAPACEVVVLLHGRDLLTYTVERDQETIDALMTVEAKFWQQVLDRDPPTPNHLATDTLRRMFRNVHKGEQRAVSPELRDIVAEYRQAAAAEKAAKARKDAAGNVLRAAVGEAEIATIDGEEAYTWKESAPEEVDLDAIEADNPGMLDLYRRPKPRRTLNIKKGFAA